MIDHATAITPIMQYGPWWAKRDDLAYADGIGASGSKIRQFVAMCAGYGPEVPMIVGCSAVSAQQIYIADMVRRTGRRGIIYTAARDKPTEGTIWAEAQGCEMNYVRPGYRTLCMQRAREAGIALGKVIRWDRPLAIDDTARQVCAVDWPAGVKRVIVPSGTGLIAAGVMAGLARAGLTVPVFAYAMSKMCDIEQITAWARKDAPPGAVLPQLVIAPPQSAYDKPRRGVLPCGSVLDPYYTAKVLPWIEPGDLLWITGVRPVAAMPPECR